MSYADKEKRKEYRKMYMRRKREENRFSYSSQTNSTLTNEIVVELVVGGSAPQRRSETKEMENKIQQEVLPEINNNIKSPSSQTNSKPKWIFSPYENMKHFVCRIPDTNGNISDKSQTIILQTIIVHKPTETHPDTFQNK